MPPISGLRLQRSNMTNELRLSDLIEQFAHEIAQKYSAPTVAAYSQALYIFGQHVRLQHNIKVQSAISSDLETEWGITFMGRLQETRSVETEHLYMRALYQFYQYVAQHTDMALNYSELAQYIEG